MKYPDTTALTEFSKKLCKHGHHEVIDDVPMTKRFVLTRGNSCVVCFTEWMTRYEEKVFKDPIKKAEHDRKNAEYQRKLREKYPEHMREYQAEFHATRRKQDPLRYKEYARRRKINRDRRAAGLEPIKFGKVKPND